MTRTPPLPGLVWVLGTDGVDKNGVWLEADLAHRVAWVVAQMKREGRTLHLTEGLRAAGVWEDQYVTDASKTSTGGGNAWFYVGQAARGVISSALPPVGPYVTKHLTGRAIDCNAPTQADMQRRAAWMHQAGCEATVAGESWHFEAVRAPRVDLTLEEDPFMALTDAEQKRLLALAEATRSGQIAPSGKWTFDQEILNVVRDLATKVDQLNKRLDERKS